VPSEPGDEERDPLDYRFSLANERTFLAWVRTSLALLAGGIALEEIATSFLSDTARTALAALAVALSLVLVASSWWRWAQVQDVMESGGRLPHPWAVPLLAMGVAGLAGALGLAIVFS
jgi:putative membrane protein